MRKYKRISLFVFLSVVLFSVALFFLSCNKATSISFDKDTYVIAPNEVFTPTVNIFPSNADYELEISNTAVASIDGKSVKGLRSSSMATLYARSGSHVAEATLVVSEVTSNETLRYDDIKNAVFVYYKIANYEELGMETDVFSVEYYPEGAFISKALPSSETFFADGWYADRECTEFFDMQVRTVSENTTLYCRLFQYENAFLCNDERLITGIRFPSIAHPNLVFPETIDSQIIKGIAYGAFSGDTSVEKITIPYSYEIIEDFAFAGCVNLTEVVFEEGSIMNSIGNFAFGVSPKIDKHEDGDDETLDQEDFFNRLIESFNISIVSEDEDPIIKSNDDPCAKLKSINLPDSVSYIGHFAFAFCSSLEDISVPASLKEINYGTFHGTLINDINLAGVESIEGFAFSDCPNLNVVLNTGNVSYCGAYAFHGTPLFQKQISVAPYVAYAGTILIGCNDQFGKGMVGTGRHTVLESTTLIANNAFAGKNQTELTLYIEHDDLSFGLDIFPENAQDGICLVVPEDTLSDYKHDNPDYSQYFCVKTTLVINSDPNEVNFGQHTLLRFSDTLYYYDKFTVITWHDEERGDIYRSPLKIEPNALPEVGQYIVRINTRAINLRENNGNGGRLTTLKLGVNKNVPLKIATLAVINCTNLTVIDLTNAYNIVEITSNSFQFTTLNEDCKIYVGNGDLNAYKNAWLHSGAAYNKLTEDPIP